MTFGRAVARFAFVVSLSLGVSLACEEEEEPLAISCTDRVVADAAFIDEGCGCEGAGLVCPASGYTATEADCLCISAGAECPEEIEGGLVCGEGEAAFQCVGGTLMERFECPGIGDCMNGLAWSFVRCGTESASIGYALEGLPCATEQAVVCTPDQGAVLKCQVGVWVVSETCSGGVEKCELISSGDHGIQCRPGDATCLTCAPG